MLVLAQGRPHWQHGTIMAAGILSVPLSYLPGYELLFPLY